MRIAMRLVVVAALVGGMSAPALAQQASASSPAQAMKGFASSADVAALVAKAKRDRKGDQTDIVQPLLNLAPYTVFISTRFTTTKPNVHEREAELFYVIDGSGTIVTGGKLVKEVRTNAENLIGTAIEGGTSQHVTKGDFVMVPEGTPHWFSVIDGSPLVVMALHLPRPAK